MRQRLFYLIQSILSLLTFVHSLQIGDYVDVTTYGEVLCSQYDASTKTGYFSTAAYIFKIDFTGPNPLPSLIAQPNIGAELQPACYFDIPNQVGYFFYIGTVATVPAIAILKVSLIDGASNSTVLSVYGLSYFFNSYWDDVNNAFYFNGAPISDDRIFINKFFKVPFSSLSTYINQSLNGTFPGDNGMQLTISAFNIGTNVNGFHSAGAWDKELGIGIFASNNQTSQIFLTRNNATSIGVTDLDVSFRSATIPVNGVVGIVYDSIRKLAYFYTQPTNNLQASVIKVDIRAFYNGAPLTYTQIYLQSDQQIDFIGAAVIDTQGGKAYFATKGISGNFGTVFQVGLKNFNSQNRVALDGTQTNAKTGIIDTSDRLAYFSVRNSASTSFGLVAISLSIPCPTDASVNPIESCTGRGFCDYETCVCNANGFNFNLYPNSAGWGGVDCNYIACPANCFANQSRGYCTFENRVTMGECTCTDINYTGPGCQTRQCPNACSQHGTCDTSTWTCTCDDLWGGASCSTPYMPCESLTSCDTCRLNTSCGWCRSAKKCLIGDIDGPLNQGCLSWYYGECPDIGMEFWSYFFTAVAVLLMTVNIYSVMTEDKDAPSQMTDTQIKASWWRNQRSGFTFHRNFLCEAKFWVMIDQIQFAATCATFAVKSSSLFNNFVSVFRWSLIGFPLPWNTRTNIDPLTRDILSMEQYTSTVTAYTDELLSGSLFWLAILILLVLLIFGIFFIVNIFVHSKNLADFVRNRVVYVLLRIALFAYLPFAIYSSYSLSYASDSTEAAVIGGIVLVLFVVGLPVAVFFVIPRNKSQAKKIFEINYLKKFGSIYNSFYYKRVWYMEVLLGKKLITGLIIGFLHSYELTQMIILIVIQVVYFIQLIVLKPYLDNLHTVLDAACTIADAIVIGLMFGFLSSVNASPRTRTVLGALAAAVLILSQVMCVLAFIASWFKYRNIQTWKQLWNRCRGKAAESVDVEDIELPVQKAD